MNSQEKATNQETISDGLNIKTTLELELRVMKQLVIIFKRSCHATAKTIQKDLDFTDARLEEMEPAVNAGNYLSMGRKLSNVQTEFDMVNRVYKVVTCEVKIQIRAFQKIIDDIEPTPNEQSKQNAMAQMNNIKTPVAQYMDYHKTALEKCLHLSTALVEDIELAVWREKKKQKKVRNKKYYIGTFDTVDE